MARRAPPPPPLPEWDAPSAYTMAKGAFAKEMEVTPAAVSQWLTRGMPVRPDNLIDMHEAAKWLRANLDQANGFKTRAEAGDLMRFVAVLTSERRLARGGVEAAACAAHEAALAAGLDPAAAAHLADSVALGTVARLNPMLTDEGNLPLPPPPVGLWARAEAPLTV